MLADMNENSVGERCITAMKNGAMAHQMGRKACVPGKLQSQYQEDFHGEISKNCGGDTGSD